MIKLFFTGWRLLLTPLALLAVVVFCGLGVWQVNRLQQRLAQNELINQRMAAPPVVLDPRAVDAGALNYRFVQIRGTYDPTQEILLRNRSYRDETGYHVLTPLRISGSDKAVLVDRGWIPLTVGSPEQRQQFAPPAGEVTVVGVARESQDNRRAPQDPPLGPDRPRLDAWFQVNIPRIEQQLGYPLVPIFIEVQATEEVPRALPVPGYTTDLGPGPHMAYAIQWFAFALITLIGYPVLIYHNVYLPRKAGRGAPEPDLRPAPEQV